LPVLVECANIGEVLELQDMPTGISWTDETWNPFAGCSKISPGCTNCYAIDQAYRNAAMGQKLMADGKNAGRLEAYQGLTEKKGDRVQWTGEVHFIPEALLIPFGWKKPRRIFVNSMSDLFHREISQRDIAQAMAAMAYTERHTYQVLTKRPSIMRDAIGTIKQTFRTAAVDLGLKHQFMSVVDYQSHDYEWPLPNLHLGVTVENQQTAGNRIPILRKTPAALRFLSCEPLLEPIDLGDLTGIDWVIVGGESGPRSRPCDIRWIESIVSQCKAQGVAVWVKQLGSHCLGLGHGYTGKGIKTEEWPESIRVQEHAATVFRAS
jgi:protein gp37